MAKFYTTAQGSHGATHRVGSLASGVRASVQSCDGSVITELKAENGSILVNVEINDNQSANTGEKVFTGSILDFKNILKDGANNKPVYVVIGGLWWDKLYGNTYNNPKLINCKTGERQYLGFTYGYGSSYYHDARKHLELIHGEDNFILIDGGSFYMNKNECKKGWF